MIKEKELSQVKSIRYPNGQNMDFRLLQSALGEQARAYGIEMAFYIDEIKYGGMLSSNSEQCLVVHHPSHIKDYFKFAITIKYQGTYAFITVYSFGESVQKDNNYLHNHMKGNLKSAWNSDIGLAGVAGTLLGTGIRRITKGGANKQKLEEEKQWYAIVKDIFKDVLNG